jgi:hypothetical protein
MHFGTFQLTAEGIDEPLRALDAARRERGVAPGRFAALGFGDTMRLSAPVGPSVDSNLMRG